MLGGRKQMNKEFIIRIVHHNGEKIIWKEKLNDFNKGMTLDDDDKDIVNKANDAGVSIPEGKENAITKTSLITMIISQLSFTI